MEGTYSSVRLPRYVVLQSQYNSKYLSYINDNTQLHGFLRFSGKQAVSPYAKYEVERAKSSANTGLVHIRCSYNNKYWRKQSENSLWIAALADESNENHSDWSCTLFEPVYVNGQDATQGVRFRSVQNKHYACLWRAAEPYSSCLYAGSESPNNELCDVCTIIDWETLLVLPKHVAFKGDNGKYLTAAFQERHQYLQFSSDDIGAPGVGNEVFITSNGSVVIKSDYYGKFWRRSPNWIWADTDLNITDPSSIDNTKVSNDLLFWPIKLGDKEVALRNLGNNYFCKRLTTEGKESCLNAGVSTISKEARLEVSEIVVSRDIYNVDYRLLDSRIYNQTAITMATGNAINDSQEPNTVDLKLSYVETKTTTWNAGVSLKLGAKITFETGIPQIIDGKVELSGEFTGTYTWGKAETTTQTLETTYKVAVPARTRVRVSMLATKGSCNVPFSYTQRDTLTNGQQVPYYMDDGVYTGFNSYNFKYETKEETL
ncbi:uncharacterized protein LOC111384706 [Olea europaea var. sylvestris]|uniref:Uncharacterized protein LOC111384706 n=1 Tax=Olea europaea subsp. europaea TaxID=158383 RepID=A0A8S0V102_OLEEU|nr:uncharacterized protein LOC111384706 [Olea europaea var. sylvestris]CAA3023403.1 uncharacterized protein LOC111384706 [Olea europaea subsp. europaea]